MDEYQKYIESMRATYDPLYTHDYQSFNAEYDLLVFGTTEESSYEIDLSAD